MIQMITKQKLAKSFIWSLLEKFGSQGLQFIISVILARILLPEDYGIVALIQIFIQIANVFVVDGFNTALIQKKDSDELDFSSVFFATCIIAFLLYIIIFFLSPIIASFYNQKELTKVLRIFSLSLVYTPLLSCQYAYIAKHLMFKIYVIRSFICLIVSGTIAILLAKNGFGVYSLVFQQLIYGILNAFILLICIKWKPTLKFSYKRLKKLMSFGWKFTATGILENIFKNIYSLIIGKTANITQLSFYNRGQQLPGLVANNFVLALRNVIFPTFSSKNDNIEELKNMLRRANQINAYILFPLLLGLAAVSEPIVKILLTDKWIPSVPFLRLCCIYFVFYNYNAANMSAINSLGKSDIYLKYEIIKKIIIIIALAFTIPFGIYYMIAGQIATGLISSILNMFPAKKHLNYLFREQLCDIFDSFLLSIIMAIFVFLFSFLHLNVAISLLIQIIFGIAFYILFSFIFKIKGFVYITSIIKNKKGTSL